MKEPVAIDDTTVVPAVVTDEVELNSAIPISNGFAPTLAVKALLAQLAVPNSDPVIPAPVTVKLPVILTDPVN